ncbi:hypothetical protein OS493_025372 [Desmophyllum pertusum]|uniref:EF-hand domain-containing protein n=1 Tax=Desmophyllum pertusum TaxID=174260 RepID=A0A9X0CPP6_9CNID|nr:hypothetical protein OS493_025372 [Desmophyllum pertusum]
MAKSPFGKDVPACVIRSYFKDADKDDSGSLEKSEVLAMLRQMGMDERQAEVCFMLVDKDGSQSVSEKELLEWHRTGEGYKMVDDPTRYAFVRRLVDEFKKYDKDASGVIDKAEFRALLASGSDAWSRCSDKQIAKALKTVDKDGSGTVSFSEYLAWVETKYTMNGNIK